MAFCRRRHTGDVLIVESLELFASITGKVDRETSPQGNAAMRCNPALPTDFPYAEVTGRAPRPHSPAVDGSYNVDGDFSRLERLLSDAWMHFFCDQLRWASPDDLTVRLCHPPHRRFFCTTPTTPITRYLPQSNAYVHAQQARAFLLKYLPTSTIPPPRPGSKSSSTSAPSRLERVFGNPLLCVSD